MMRKALIFFCFTKKSNSAYFSFRVSDREGEDNATANLGQRKEVILCSKRKEKEGGRGAGTGRRGLSYNGLETA